MLIHNSLIAIRGVGILHVRLGVSNMQPVVQNQPANGYSSAHWMALQSVIKLLQCHE